MVISYVLRLRPDSLADGQFVGEIEAVTSQERTKIRTLDQLTTFILATRENQVCCSSAARQLAGGGAPGTSGGAPGAYGGPQDGPAR